MNIEEKKKMGLKGKAGEGLAGCVRPLDVHDENDCLMQCSPPSSAAAAEKKGVLRPVWSVGLLVVGVGHN